MAAIIVYFSREGNNYVNGSIVSLKVGNTETAAKFIHELTGAEMFRLEPVKPYSADYNECTSEAQQELRAKARPAVKALPDISGYDVVYLGYPNWWGTCPMCVFTFLESQDWTGKTIKPFCTHEGSGMGHSEADIKKACSGANIMKGLAIHGADVAKSKPLIENWIN
ncbi:MAG: flavodoxin [Synergistaceae bacterium]|nr:flavodoxin [Synergistaceae bacterium]